MFLLNLFGLNSLTILISSLVVLYFYLKRNNNYWKSRGLDGPKPWVGLGTFWQFFYKDLFQLSLDNTKKYGKIYGEIFGTRPNLVVSDPQIIKDISIKDFHLFVDRTDIITGDLMNDRSLFNLLGDEWKKIRSIISPTFSSGKMRRMHPIIIDCVHTLEKELEKEMKKSNELNIKKFMSNFTIDVIATCAFGTKINAYSEERNEFIINAQKAFRGTWRIWLFFLMSFISPKLLQLTKFEFLDPSVTQFFKSAIRSIISKRESEGVKHNDYIQLMINARDRIDDEEQDIEDDNTEQLFRQSDDKQTVKNTKVKESISEMDILATSFLFFVAGFETTAATLANLMYLLAKDEKRQQRLYEEVRKYGPNFSYEDVSRMPYLEACVAETLRLYNPISATTRVATEDYKLGDTGITVEKGMIINLDMHSVHHSPEYFDEPDKFIPERFLPENRDKLVPYTYMPFGMGPRNCVGMRFALMEAKTAAAFLVSKFRVLPSENTPKEIKAPKYEFILTVPNIPLKLEIRDKSVQTNGI